MGGFGSGYPGWGNRKTVVEDCLPLTMDKLRRDRLLYPPTPGPGLTGSLAWHSSRTKTHRGSVAYYLGRIPGHGLVLTLNYRVGGENGERIELPLLIEERADGWWWFRCPLSLEGRPCLRRCCKLWLPPGGRLFGCRQCHRLTYTSCRESHQTALVEYYKKVFAEEKRFEKRYLGRKRRLFAE